MGWRQTGRGDGRDALLLTVRSDIISVEILFMYSLAFIYVKLLVSLCGAIKSNS